jgi:copper chaperone CopZ
MRDTRSVIEERGMTNVTLAIKGMSCGHCVKRVQQALAATPGVAKATVTLEPAQARVEFDDQAATPEQLAAAVTTAGYPASVAG